MNKVLTYCLITVMAFVTGWISHTQYQLITNKPTLTTPDSVDLIKNKPAQFTIKKTSTKNNDANNFSQMLSEKRYENAIRIYSNIYNINEKAAKQLHKNLADHIQILTEQKAYIEAEELSRLYLDSFQTDIKIWNILSDVQIAQGYYIEALLNFYQARNSAMSPEEFDRITDAGRHVVTKIDKHLNEKGETFKLIALYNEFTAMDDNSVDFTYRLAELHQKVDQIDIAISLLETINTDPVFGEQAQKLLTDITHDTTPNTAIPIIRSGEHYIVQATINNNHTINLMIDTGASISALTQENFNSLKQLTDFTFVDKIFMNTASGQVKADMHQVATLSIEEFILSDINFVIMPYKSQKNVHGLLGMNVLSQFDFTIDQRQSLLLLKPRKESL